MIELHLNYANICQYLVVLEINKRAALKICEQKKHNLEEQLTEFENRFDYSDIKEPLFYALAVRTTFTLKHELEHMLVFKSAPCPNGTCAFCTKAEANYEFIDRFSTPNETIKEATAQPEIQRIIKQYGCGHPEYFHQDANLFCPGFQLEEPTHEASCAVKKQQHFEATQYCAELGENLDMHTRELCENIASHHIPDEYDSSEDKDYAFYAFASCFFSVFS